MNERNDVPEINFTHRIMDGKHSVECYIKNNLKKTTAGTIEFPGTSVNKIEFRVKSGDTTFFKRDAPMSWIVLPQLTTFVAPEEIQGWTVRSDGIKRSILDRVKLSRK